MCGPRAWCLLKPPLVFAVKSGLTWCQLLLAWPQVRPSCAPRPTLEWAIRILWRNAAILTKYYDSGQYAQLQKQEILASWSVLQLRGGRYRSPLISLNLQSAYHPTFLIWKQKTMISLRFWPNLLLWGVSYVSGSMRTLSYVFFSAPGEKVD
jgi:hypothetical protein